jgi:hypothetical protein
MTETVDLNPPFPTLLTHRGWFGICPIYMGDVYSDAPVIVERHRLLRPLMKLSQWLQMIWVFLQTFPFGGNGEWVILQGPELESPRWLMDDGSVK